MNDPKPIDFAAFGDPLNKLLIAIGNKLSREWPTTYQNVIGARELLVVHLRTAHMTYRSALYLGGDIPADPRRLPEFSESLPVLNRSILDSLLTVLFILEDVPGRCAWFYEADWREGSLDLDRYVAEYGNLPEWQQYLKDLAWLCDVGLVHANLSTSQAANPKALRSWPNPGAMVNLGVSPSAPLPPVRAFMKYLNDYFYIDLSQQSHLGGRGLVKRGAFFLDEIRNIPATDDQIRKYRYSQIGQAVALVLALASEIEMHFNFGLRQDALFIWTLAASVIVVVNEVYEKRYRGLL
jgi:hypothetical protein